MIARNLIREIAQHSDDIFVPRHIDSAVHRRLQHRQHDILIKLARFGFSLLQKSLSDRQSARIAFRDLRIVFVRHGA